jgi:hypothetical protein
MILPAACVKHNGVNCCLLSAAVCDDMRAQKNACGEPQASVVCAAESAYRGARRKATDVGAAAHNHPFSTVLVGMGVAALFTYLLLQRRD